MFAEGSALVRITAWYGRVPRGRGPCAVRETGDPRLRQLDWSRRVCVIFALVL